MGREKHTLTGRLFNYSIMLSVAVVIQFKGNTKKPSFH